MDLIEVWLKDPLKHWYYRHKFAAIKREAKLAIDLKSIVDIGAGSAIFSRELLKLNNEVQVQAVDIGYEYEGIDRNEIRINYSRTCTNYDADLFLLTDVLEHVEDDYNFLNLIVSKAKPGAIFIITVPCFMSLWSYHDEYLKHFRRYTLDQLEVIAVDNDLIIKKSYYLFGLLYPIAFISRKFGKRKMSSQLREAGNLENTIFLLLLSFDKLFTRIFKFGISGLLVAEKDFLILEKN